MTPAERAAALLRGDKKALAGEYIASALADIADNVFRPGVKLTFIARVPGNDDADLLMTDDDLVEVAKAVERRRAAGPDGAL